jgi:hypothetical protein
METKNIDPSGQDIDDKRYELEQVKDEYLRIRGWVKICNVPGSAWLWKKNMEGPIFKRVSWLEGQYVCSTETAIDIERDLYTFEHPECFDD